MKLRFIRSGLFAGLLAAAVLCAGLVTSNQAEAKVDPSSMGATQSSGEAQWQTNFDKALAQAKEEDRPILIDFTGSDWCGWCKKLDKETFSKSEFKKYASSHLVLVKADFPQRKKLPADVVEQNKKLAEEYGVRGFPTLVLLDSEGNKIWQNVGYLAGGPDALIKELNDATED